MDSGKKSGEEAPSKVVEPAREVAAPVKPVIEAKVPETPPVAPKTSPAASESGPVDYKAVREAIVELLDDERFVGS